MTNETGSILKSLRLSRGMSQQQVADLVGAKSYTTVSKWESGENSPQGKDIRILSEFFKVSSDSLLGIEKLVIPLREESSYPHIPPLSAGLPVGVEGITDDHTEIITIPDYIMGKWAGRDDIYIAHVNGDSMNRIIPHGSIIAIKQIEPSELKDDDIVVYSDGGDYSVKRFYRHGDTVIFRPDSTDSRFTDYVTSTSNSDLNIHGKVVVHIVTHD